MTVQGNALPRGAGDAAHPVEALPAAGYTGFRLQATAHKVAAMGPQGMIAATAVAGAAAVNLVGATGSLPRLMVPANVQADYTAKFAIANRYMRGGDTCIRYDVPIAGGGGCDVPIDCIKFDHQVIVREAGVWFDACLTAEPSGKFLAASILPDNARMPGGNAMHFMRNVLEYFGISTRAQLDADGLHFILGVAPSVYDTLTGGSPGMHDGPGGPVRIADPGTQGDMQLEMCLFVQPGFESPQASVAAMAGWDALNTKYIELGALDGIWQQGVAPFTRGAQYFNPQVFPAWMMTGDRNDYTQMFETHNYFMSLKRKWRDTAGGRPIPAQNNMMALMGVIPQRAVNYTNFPAVPRPPPPVPPAAAAPDLASRSIAYARVAFP